MNKLIFLLIYLFSTTLASANTNYQLEPLPKFDWGKIMNLPPVSTTNDGNQVLHFNLKNKHYKNSKEATQFVEKYLKAAKELHSDSEVLRFASDAVSVKGAFIEVGVGTGRTTNFIAALNYNKTIYGFDSFQGILENWERFDINIPLGTFAIRDESYIPPPVLNNVVLYKGLFHNTLPLFRDQILKGTPIAFLHVDCALYDSTQDVLIALKNNIVDGTIIVFDELYNYPGYDKHEWKAFQEFLEINKLHAKYIAYNAEHEQVAVRIVKK